MTATQAYAKLLLEKFPMGQVKGRAPGEVATAEVATPENVFTGIILDMSKRIEVLEKQNAENIKVLKVLAGALTGNDLAKEAAPVAEGEDKPIEQMSEEEMKEFAKRPNTGGGPAVNAQPIMTPPTPKKNGSMPVPPPAPEAPKA